MSIDLENRVLQLEVEVRGLRVRYLFERAQRVGLRSVFGPSLGDQFSHEEAIDYAMRLPASELADLEGRVDRLERWS